jgi:hypothetical protein
MAKISNVQVFQFYFENGIAVNWSKKEPYSFELIVFCIKLSVVRIYANLFNAINARKMLTQIKTFCLKNNFSAVIFFSITGSL